ncbi:hypothetical protein SAMN04487967_1682 [Natronorubrum sediminis]|uniref:Uncharacterized protein n=1 Tax=Natronorubrum sediminis TaxID=640943 RepID=A0A1H6FUX5_9EURY|nr:twin-arginine translocation signal domain-containing protein [Natronorubrum sediminis]SEH14606.1 hypothetical protein SAMN04487967_1682 [Natronorubrum sediminis]
MNRRTLLQSAGVAATVGLAGCVDGVREHFGLQGIVPIEIHSEAEESRSIVLEARERETGRESYDQSITVGPNETVGPPNLNRNEQSLRIAEIHDDEEGEVLEASITEDSQLVVIEITDDEMTVEVDEGDDADNHTVEDDSNGVDDSDEDDDSDDSETTDEDDADD